MTRFILQQGAIEVAYGSDDLFANLYTYFLSVSDERLSYDEKYGDESEAMKIIESVDASQSGTYFHINTAEGMIGKHVSRETMVNFMKLYGVPEKHWKLVEQGKEISG
ncbi:hypothetical protein V5O48_015540 [Marasmius crinis-equi]|uniref:Uncharacterized protein n=1 Tax=Marasmius crinis-equi TaxID=585013 RepID=A0ABR3EU99_9AGAR